MGSAARWLSRLPLLLAVAGCTSESKPDPKPDAEPPGAPFIGTWQYQAGSMLTVDCSGSPSVYDLTGMSFALQESATADFELPWDGQCPPIQFSVTDSTAAALQQPCAYYKGGSGCQAANVSTDRYPFTLTLDAALTIDGHTSTMTTSSCGGTTTCTSTIVGTAVKLP